MSKIKITILLIAIVIFILLSKNGFFEYFDKDMIESLLHMNSSSAPYIFIAFYSIITVLFIPVGPFVILAGALFGALNGLIYVLIGAVIGGVMSMYISRFFIRDFIQKYCVSRFPRIIKYQEYIETNKNGTLFLLRFTPIIPSNVLNYTCGTVKVRLSTFVWTLVLGVAPGTFFYTYLGQSLMHITVTNVILILVFAIAMLLITWYVKKLLPKNNQ